MGNSGYQNILDLMGQGIYSKDQLYDLVYRVFPDYSPNSCLWVIGELVSRHEITSIGYGLFRKRILETFQTELSAKNKKILELSKQGFPYSSLCIYQTSWIDELLSMPGGPDATILEIDKENTFSLYYSLHHKFGRNVMVEPKEHDLEMYFENSSIIVKKLFSKSPVNKDGSLRLEKYVVDLLSDRTIKHFYYGVDLEPILVRMLQKYECNYSTLLTYAKRRKVEDQIREILRQSLPDSLMQILDNNTEGVSIL